MTKAESPPISGGPLPVFQAQVLGGGNPSAMASSAAGIGEWKSRLLFAETLPDGGVRFVFLVSPEEFKIEETADLLGENWRLLPDDEFKAMRESNVDGQDRLTIILPQAEEKQRFLRLAPQR